MWPKIVPIGMRLFLWCLGHSLHMHF